MRILRMGRSLTAPCLKRSVRHAAVLDGDGWLGMLCSQTAAPSSTQETGRLMITLRMGRSLTAPCLRRSVRHAAVLDGDGWLGMLCS